MPRQSTQQDPVLRELTEIKALLQGILIIQGARAGLTRDDVRKLVGVSNKRVSDVWAHLKASDNQQQA